MNEQNLVPFKKGEDPRREGNGRPKGSKSLSTIVRELENEEYDWTLVPLSPKALKRANQYGAPWRAIVIRALADALDGNVKAAEFLRRAGYGDKLDLTTKGDRIIQEPVILADVKPRQHVEAETQTTDGS